MLILRMQAHDLFHNYPNMSCHIEYLFNGILLRPHFLESLVIELYFVDFTRLALDDNYILLFICSTFTASLV
jgi:hypothetical protein